MPYVVTNIWAQDYMPQLLPFTEKENWYFNVPAETHVTLIFY